LRIGEHSGALDTPEDKRAGGSMPLDPSMMDEIDLRRKRVD